MGSGNGGLYFGTKCGSQPYKELYEVVPDMLRLDKQDSDIYSQKKGYFKNPTATDLLNSISNGCVYIGGRVASGLFTYVVSKGWRIIFGKRCNPNDINKRSPHPTLIGGKKPKVRCAGIIDIRNGKILSVNNNSGHYRPNIESLALVNNILLDLYNKNKDVFDEQSNWRKNDKK